MAKFKVLKNGFTDIDSTDISDFSIHSDYKCQKLALADSVTVVMDAFSGSASGVINHNLGYIPSFFCFVEYGGKGYETVGNANPILKLKAARFFDINASDNYIYSWDANGDQVDHNLVYGDTIKFKLNPSNTSLPSPLNESTTYYYKSDFSSTKFYISATLGGSTIDLRNGVGPESNYWAKTNNFEDLYDFYVDAVFDIYADDTKLNIQVTVSDLDGRVNFSQESFIVRAFFIMDEII
jgi:hypothetical protein